MTAGVVPRMNLLFGSATSRYKRQAASLARWSCVSPISLDSLATMGAAPVPVPPPMPAVMKTRSAP